MADINNKPDPINPENTPITDGMERDGKTLRDLHDGKTPTEQVFGIDLGSKELQDAEKEHDELLQQVGEIVAQEAGRTKASEPDTSPVQVETPDVAPQVQGPVAELAALHGDLMQEIGKAVTPEQKRAARQEELAKRRVQHRLRSEHGEKFVELGRVIEDSRPEPDAPLGPDAVARLAHPGKEKPGSFEEAVTGFAHEDKLWRAAASDLFKTMEDYIHQSRLELEAIRGALERNR